jgi:hypothetical protein
LSGTFTIAFLSSISTFSTLAGFKALAISNLGSSTFSIKSIFSQFSKSNIFLILSPFKPTKTPTGSTLGSSLESKTLVLIPGILTIFSILTFHSSNSGTFCFKIASINSGSD